MSTDLQIQPTKRLKREDVPKGANLCEYCTAKCCRYFALPIETPDCLDEYQNLRWYMLHGRVSIFVDEGTWFLMVHSDCQALQDDNRCGIYETRPDICRAYTTKNCEFEGDGCYEKFFEVPEQMAEYAEAMSPPVKRKKRKKVALPLA